MTAEHPRADEAHSGRSPRPHFGVNLLGQHATWDELRDAAIQTDGLGFDSLWTWDQFTPFTGDANGPMFEAWQLLAAWGALTANVKVGTLVTANTYRHPAVLASMAATLDHVTAGRAILGLGAGFNEREHASFGIPFPAIGDRLTLLDEACEAIRMLLDTPVADFDGRHLKLRDAVCEPKPVQARLPILVGGGGERKTMRTVARFADYWHCPPSASLSGSLAQKLEILHRHCDEVGRDPAEITTFVTVSGAPRGGAPLIVLRDTPAEVGDYWKQAATRGRLVNVPEPSPTTVERIVEDLVARWRLGARGFLFYIHMPFDLETVSRLARDVRPMFEQAIA